MSHSSSGSSSAASTGQVLGATAPAVLGAAGAAILPITGSNPLIMLFVILSITIATFVLISFVVSRVIRKFF
ncbi:MAG: hypothetical protein IT410_02125 [Candidatus Doudnabacteria bacterium]|nr:hypothetical protein [Candidatus Doudnabacteria bacterium]